MDLSEYYSKMLLKNKKYDEMLINKYFSENYVQIVNAKELDFENFKAI